MVWKDLDNVPTYFITINGRVPKNMSGKGTEEFQLWPVKHQGNYRWSGRSRYHYPNSKGYYYSVKRYTFWDGVLHSHTRHYGSDTEIEYLERVMGSMAQNHREYLLNGNMMDNGYGRPFFNPDDERFINTRYTWKGS